MVAAAGNRARSSSGLIAGAISSIAGLDAVTKFDAVDDLGQLIFAVRPPPGFRGGLDELEDHQLCGFLRYGLFDPDASMAASAVFRSGAAEISCKSVFSVG